MICSKKELKEYLLADKKALGMDRKRPRLFADEIWKLEIALRKYEYALNTGKGLFGKIMRAYRHMVYHRAEIRLTVSIPPNTCGKGLAVVHYGNVIINRRAKIGDDFRVQSGCVVGAKSGKPDSPVIGDHVRMGAGSKILGGINIADGVMIGANAVVVKPIDEPNTTWAGIPAHKIR